MVSMTLKNKIRDKFPNEVPFPRGLELLCDWCEQNGYPISGGFELRADNGYVSSWFGSSAANDRLAMFGAGSDGSLYCIWNNGEGHFPIVHLGSEGDALKVLAGDFYEFLRLLAVGYDELGFDNLSHSPSSAAGVNPEFRSWLQDQLSLEIPSDGQTIFREANEVSPDFQAWVNSIPIP